MSELGKDRVRFKINAGVSRDMQKLIKDTLGVDLPLGNLHGDCAEHTIICRPSQFARFLIERNTRSSAARRSLRGS